MKDGYDYYSKPLSGTELRTMERNRSMFESTLEQMGKDPSMSYMVPMSTKPMSSTELRVLARNMENLEATRRQMNFDFDNRHKSNSNSSYSSKQSYSSYNWSTSDIIAMLIIMNAAVLLVILMLCNGFGWLEQLINYFK